MAGYVKIWTTLANKPEFMSSSALHRGLYLQLLFWAKVMGDTGVISVQSWTALGSLLACDARTARKFLSDFSGESHQSQGILQQKSSKNAKPMQQNYGGNAQSVQDSSKISDDFLHGLNKTPVNLQDFCFLTYKETDYGAIIIEIPKYRYWQELEVKQLVEKIKQKSSKIPLFTRPDLPDLPHQTNRSADKPPTNDDEIAYDKIIHDLNEVLGLDGREKFRVGEACKKDIRARFGEGYNFEDFKIVHRKRAMRWLHDPENRQYLRPSTLYRASKFPGYLTDRLPGQSELDRMSPQARETAINMMKVLKRMEDDDREKKANSSQAISDRSDI